jgi:integrase
VQEGTISTGGDPAESKIIAAYITHLTNRGLSRNTKRVYRGTLQYLAEWLGDVDLLQADAEELLGWRESLNDLDRRCGYHVGPVCDASVAAYVAAVRGFYGWAVKKKYIDEDPAEDIPVPKRGKRYPRPIGEQDLEDAIDAADPRVRPWLVLAAYMGMRCDEIAHLRREDILDTARTPIVIVHGKGNKERIVPMTTHVWGEIRPGLPRNGWCFLRRDGQPGPVTSRIVSGLGNEHLKDCGIAATMHQLRHRFGTAGYEVEHDILTLADMMGHASTTTTAGYAAHSPASAVRIVHGIQPKRRLRQVRKKPGEG